MRGRGSPTSITSVTLDGRPRRTITRSPISTASSIEWVTKTIDVGLDSQIRSSSNCRISRVCASIDANGSSISSTSGSTASARARPVRCCMPPESWYGYAFSKPFRPTSSMKRGTFSSISRFGAPAIWSPYATLP